MCGSKKSTQETKVNYPSYVTDAVQQALGAAQNAASTPYSPYGGQLVAPLNPIQGAGIAGIAGSVGSAQPYLDQAYNMATGIRPVTPTAYSPSAVQQYESPYNADVINATRGQMALLNAQQQNNLVGNAASQHALGGDRVAVAQAQLAGQQAAQEAPTLANLYNQNYQQALQEFNTQQQTGMAAQEANNYTGLYGAGELGNLGQLQLGTGLQGYGALLQAGGLGQQTQQAQDTAAYQQYLTGQQYPFQTAQYLASISQGLGGLYSGNRTTTTTQPSNVLGTIAGLGLSAAGLGAFGAPFLPGIFGSAVTSVPGISYGGASLPSTSFYGGGLFADGGSVRKFANGGDDDEDPFDAEEAQQPDFGADDDAYGPTGGFEGASPAPSPMADLASLAAPAGGQGIVSGEPQFGAQLPQTPQGNSLGLDPIHMLMLQAGAGMMASRSPYLGQELGEGLQKGLAAYQQERQQEQLMGYRNAMSQAATQRAEALSKHYENADARPKVVTNGPTVQFLYPNGDLVDSHIPTTAYGAEQAREKYYDEEAKFHQGELGIRRLIAGKTGAGQGGVFGFKYNAWLGVHPNDKQGALEYAAGHKQLGEADIDKIAMQQATTSANAMASAGNFDSTGDYDTYRKAQYQQNRDLLSHGIGGGTPGAAPAPAPAPGGGTIAPPVPQGVPTGARYSPSQKNWWWQENGKWMHN